MSFRIASRFRDNFIYKNMNTIRTHHLFGRQSVAMVMGIKGWTERNILFGWHDNTTESTDIGGLVLYICPSQDSDDVAFDGFPFLLNILQQLAFKNKTIDNFNRKWKDLSLFIFLQYSYISFCYINSVLLSSFFFPFDYVLTQQFCNSL